MLSEAVMQSLPERVQALFEKTLQGEMPSEDAMKSLLKLSDEDWERCLAASEAAQNGQVDYTKLLHWIWSSSPPSSNVKAPEQFQSSNVIPDSKCLLPNP